MRKVGQGAILIMGGVVGCLAAVVHIQERKFGMAALYLLGVVAAFALAWWLIKEGKKELDGN